MIFAGELEKYAFPAYRPAMSIHLSDRIKRLRTAKGMTQAEFADLLNTTQGTVARWEKGSAPKHDALASLAGVAGTSVEHFLGKPMRHEDSPDIQVVGYVGAGAAVYAYDDFSHGDGLETVDRPEFVKGRAVAVEVKGDSLIPVAEDGWRLIYTGEQSIIEADVLNRLCVVRLTDGRTLVKRVVRGSKPERYHLLSTNAPMIEDVEIDWAARVRAIIPN